MKTYQLRNPLPLAPIAAAKHAMDADVPDGSWKALTKREKIELSQLAASAAKAQGLELKGKSLNAWRAEQSIHACGVRISEATHGHYADIKSHFQDLGGRPEAAFKTQMREGDNKRRVAMFKLQGALREKQLPPAYAAAICRTQFKCELEKASAKQLWCLFYTVTNRKKVAGASGS